MAVSSKEDKSDLSERHITAIWQRGLICGQPLVTENGKRIQVIYPGRRNDGPGADFRDAVIIADSGILKGDVEIHVRSSGWTEHGHHRNPAYNSVMLHVVMRDNSGRPAILQNGKVVPVIALEKYSDIFININPGAESLSGEPMLPCHECLRKQDRDTVIEFLEHSGEKRFLEKTDELYKGITEAGPGETLYRGIMGALGYSRNKEPFLELARRLPLRVLESAEGNTESGEDFPDSLRSYLLGISGLIPGRYGTDFGDDLPSYIRPMSADGWCLFKVRPNNSPVRRLMAMSCLLLRYREKGLLNGLLGLVKETLESGRCRRLEEGLRVSFLGGARAADIAVNVLLPFSLAWSLHISSPEMGKRITDLFLLYPRTGENSIERHLAMQLGLDKGLIDSAAKQQGLIHIYKNLCTQGKCGECPLGEFEVGDHVQVEPVWSAVAEAEIPAGGNHGGVVGAESEGRD